MTQPSLQKGGFRPSPTQIIVLGFALVIVAGAALLMLPISLAPGKQPNLLEAFFTATSCVCVTGLVVVETGEHFSLFGQIVVITLIQIGGLGFMTLATLLLMALGKRITLKERMIIQESLNADGLQGLVRLIRQICAMVMIIELAGAVLLATRMIPRFGLGRGIFYSIFHSISAFCNAGFDVLGNGDSIVSLNGDPVVMFTLMALIVLGGLGFPVILDILKKRRFSKLTLHSKVVLVMTAVLLGSGFLFFLASELGNPQSLGAPAMSWPKKLMNALFQSVTVRTAGFAALDQNALTPDGKVISSFLMFLGASPSSTGGGVKTTTFACVILVVIAALKGKTSVSVFKRRLEMSLVLRAIAIFAVALCAAAALTLALTALEPVGIEPRFTLENLLFEATSALGTVGLSAGVTPLLSVGSKLLLMIAMFAGRVGPLTLTLALSRRLSRSSKVHIEYPEDRIIVG